MISADRDKIRSRRFTNFITIALWSSLAILSTAHIYSKFFHSVTLTQGLVISGLILAITLSVAGLVRLSFEMREYSSETARILAESNAEKDIDELSQDEKDELVLLAYTDSMTKLGNKQRMLEKFNTLVADRGSDDSSFLVGAINLDGMKPINELYGMSGGDEIIKQCAQRLAAAVEGSGFVFRLRGDEFGFLFPDIQDENGAEKMGRVVQEVLQASFDIEGRTARLSGSIGFALYPKSGNTFDGIMKNIDSAVYHSKRDGNGRVTIFTSAIEEGMIKTARMEQALRRAIVNNEVRPHFQPIVSLQTGELLGFESLARWIDPELGFVSPAEFVPLAEERGFIAPLTEKLLRHAASVAANWPSNIFLSFNLSSVQLIDPETAKNIIKIIDKAGLPANRLEIEVTETAMMTDPETASMIIDQLHAAGIRISMDDFGTGQSSLGRLRELKLDKVKIDRAFVKCIGEDKSAEHIVRAILEMCAGLELVVVAEGIEEMQQAETLKRYGCHAGQGYLFGKPQDEHKTAGYIREFLGDTYHQEKQIRVG